MEYSAYQKTPDGEWVAIHRLPLKAAIKYCKMYRSQQHFNGTVALVPDGADPTPYFELVEKFA